MPVHCVSAFVCLQLHMRVHVPILLYIRVEIMVTQTVLP